MMRELVGLTYSHPWATLLTLALLALAIQVTIDVAMGDHAEYFNAARVFVAWKELLAGGNPLDIAFLKGQEQMGGMALPVATAILFIQPIIYGGAILLLIRLLGRILS